MNYDEKNTPNYSSIPRSAWNNAQPTTPPATSPKKLKLLERNRDAGKSTVNIKVDFKARKSRLKKKNAEMGQDKEVQELAEMNKKLQQELADIQAEKNALIQKLSTLMFQRW